MQTIDILYEDERVLVINKPSGLLIHTDGRSSEETVVSWIEKNRPDIVGVGEEQFLQNGERIKRPGIVHRLDKDTSGALLIAKTQESFLFFKEQFKQRNIEKIYRAFVYGTFKDSEKEGIIDKPIGRSASDFRKWSAEFGARGELRKAITHYKVLNQKEGYSYVEIKPKTGRTHQIRVHMKALSHPIICDRLYAPQKESALGFVRLALHAYRLTFSYEDGITCSITAPLPKDFVEAEKALS